MILVTGGTGLVGSHLLLRLLENNVSIKAIYRDDSNLERVEKVFSYYTDNATQIFKRIEWIKADLNNIPALEIAFKDVQFVYHTAALISFDPNDYKKLEKTNTLGTANIVNLCIDKGIKKLCYVSTIGAIGKSLNGVPATEDNEWTNDDANVYALSKHAAEMEIWRGTQEGLPVVIVNPGVIIGPGFWGSGSGAFFTTANKGYSYYPPGGTGFITVEDVIKIMIGLMDSSITNERYITVAKNLSFKEVLALISENIGKRPPNKELKRWQLKVGRYFDWLINLFTKRGRRITKNSIKSLYHRDDYDGEKIKKALNFQYEPLIDTIEFCCEKFMEENP